MASEVFQFFQFFLLLKLGEHIFFHLVYSSIACVDLFVGKNIEKVILPLSYIIKYAIFRIAVPYLEIHAINAWIVINLSSTDFPQPIVFLEKKTTNIWHSWLAKVGFSVRWVGGPAPYLPFFMHKYLESYDLESISSKKKNRISFSFKYNVQ